MFGFYNIKRILFIAFVFTTLAIPTHADRIGALLSEPDGDPSNVYAYSIILPNGTISITDGVATYTPDPNPTFESVVMGTSASGLVVTSDADGVVLTSADWGKVIWMTGAGEVAVPDAGASDIGKYITVIVRDASEQVEVVLTDATELFVLTSGTALDAGDESNMSTTSLSRTTFVYMETGRWYAFGTPTTDGGAAD